MPNGPCDILHVCYGGLSGQMDVVNGLNSGFAALGLSTAVIALAPTDQMLPPETWTSCHRLEQVHIRRRGDFQSMAQVTRVLSHLAPRAMLLHSNRHAMAAHLGARVNRRTRVVLGIEATSIPLRSRTQDAFTLVSSIFTDGTVVLSEPYKDDFWLTRLPLKGSRNLLVIPNGVDLQSFCPDGPTLAATLADVRNEKTVVIGMAGRLVPGKDFATLIRAVHLFNSALPRKRAHLLIAGSGPDHDALAALVDKLDVSHQVTFLGTLPHDEMPAFFRTLDVYAHTTDGEAMSTAILQALATRVPVVATDVAGVNEMRDLGLPLTLVPRRDSIALEGALEQTVSAIPSQALTGDSRESVLANLTWENVAKRYVQVVNHLDPEGPWSGSLRSQAEPFVGG